MAGHLSSSGYVFGRLTAPLLLSAALFAGALSSAQAFQQGHGRVTSPAGAPLSVSVPIRGLTPDDLKVLRAVVAEPAAWAQAGLSLPAAADTLSVSIEPGLDATSRTIVLHSTQSVNQPVIDVLISLTTASGTSALQSSYLILTSDAKASSGGTAQVVRGDTLYGIALARSVSGADIYQMMWAIYEANQQAFISENMNLLRAGVTLQIPDAAAIRRVDAKYAREMFARHDRAFKARRGGATTAAVAAPTVVTKAAESGKVTVAENETQAANAGDQVRLASSNPADQQADARIASANALNEMQSRVDALQKNVEELTAALKKSEAAAAAVSSGNERASGSIPPSEATGTPGVTGPAGAEGQPGSSGATGPAGPAGGAGASNTDGTVAKPVDPQAASNAEIQAATGVKKTFLQVKQYASDHVLGFVLGISGLLALLIALLLRRAGRQDRLDNSETPRESPALASDFDQKLQSIDLNLDEVPPQPADTQKTDATKPGA